MGLCELRKELISKLKAENGMIDGDLERILSPLMSKWCFPFIVKLTEQLAKTKNVQMELKFRVSNLGFGYKW